MNTHYAVITFSGDFDGDHPDEELRGRGPFITAIAAGPKSFCWEALAERTKAYPLRRGEEAEVLARDLEMIADQERAAEAYRRDLSDGQ